LTSSFFCYRESGISDELNEPLPISSEDADEFTDEQ